MKKIKTLSGSDRSEIVVSAVRTLFRSIEDIGKSKQNVVVSLSGGRSVRQFYATIAEKADLLSQDFWNKLHIFWTDERLVSPESDQSNYAMARDLMLNRLLNVGLLDRSQVHRFPGESQNVRGSLAQYEKELKRVSRGKVHLPILGVGQDGHVGSLFPRSPHFSRTDKYFLLVDDSPKPPKRRITVSPELIRNSPYPFLFFFGEEKRDAYECFRDERKDYSDCPCKLALSGHPGTCFVLTDLN